MLRQGGAGEGTAGLLPGLFLGAGGRLTHRETVYSGPQYGTPTVHLYLEEGWSLHRRGGRLSHQKTVYIAVYRAVNLQYTYT